MSESQYRELFERYLQLVSHWVKGEKIENKVTGQMEKPDEGRMAEFEALVMPKGENATDFRKGLIASVGAHRVDNPNVALDYGRIFPDLAKRLRDHFFDERKRQLRRFVENTLKYLSEDRQQLSAREQQAVRSMLDVMNQKFGYTDASARDAIVFLMRNRYA